MTNQDSHPKDTENLRQKAEALARARAVRNPEASTALSPLENRETLHELQVHQIELELQNEELRTAQARIEAGRARYFDLYDLAPVGYCTLSAKGLILETNLTTTTLLGSARRVLIKQPISRFILKDDQDIYYQHRKKLFETGEGQECELRLVKSDGACFWAHLTATAAQAEDGAPVCRCVILDITERKQAEEALRASEQQFRHLFQNLHAGVVVHGPDTQIILANEKACELLGLSVTQMTGKTANDPAWCYVREDETAMPLEEYPVQRVLATRRPIHGLVFGVDRPTTKDRVWVLVHAFPEVDAHERLRHVVVTFVDITARKKAEKALWLKNLVFDASIAAKIIVDINVIITEVNDEFLRMWAYPGKDEVVGKPLANFINDTNDAVAIVTALNETDRWDGVCRAKRKDGSIFIAHGLATTLRDRQDSLVGYQSAVLDITELKRVEEERNSLQVQLAHAQRMESVGRLAGGIAHDINNMLNIVLGYGEILFDELHPGDPLRDDVKEIVEAGKRSESMIRQLLAFSRKQTLQPEVLDLNTVIRNAEKMLSRLIGEDIELELALSDEIDRVMADPGQIEQVIMNLLVNARDAMPRGGKLILETANVVLDETFAKSHANVHPGKYVLLAVTDTGSGMDQETLTKIFDPFFTTKEMGKGTGLGLATVYGIVKQSGGNIWAYSEPGRGTTFKIYLPQTLAEQEPKMGAVGKETPKGGGEHILVVEDDDSVRKLTAAALSRLGYKVSVAANGGEALLLMEKKGLKPDLVLTDVVMPYMSGKELVNRLQIIQPDLKVLYMSGYTDDIIVRHGVLEPGTAFIHKPFNIRGIAEKVQAVLWSGGAEG